MALIQSATFCRLHGPILEVYDDLQRTAPQPVTSFRTELAEVPSGPLVRFAYSGDKAVDERELDRLAFEAGRSYDFRLAALVRDLRGHRSMLRRYVTAHLNATQARIDQLPAATQALLEAYNDAWELLGEPAPKTVAESPASSVTVSRLDPKSEPSRGFAHPAMADTEPLQQVHESLLTPSRS